MIVLKKESFSARLEAEVKVSVPDLNREECSVNAEAGPIEALRCSVFPVKRLLPRVMEPVSVLR